MIFRLLSPCSAFFCPDKKESFECDKALALVYVCLGELVSDERNYLVDSLKLWQIHLRVKTHRKIIILFLTNLLNIHCSCAFDELDYDNETMMETQTYSHEDFIRVNGQSSRELKESSQTKVRGTFVLDIVLKYCPIFGKVLLPPRDARLESQKIS
jgi:hypothetical protein